MSEYREMLDAMFAPSLSRDEPNLLVARAEGTCYYDHQDRRYLDFISGIGACNLGHCHPGVVAAITAQAQQLIHGPMGIVMHDPILELARRLPAILPGEIDSFFFGSSGTEAVEGAVKLARNASGRHAIIGFLGGFHGRTYISTTMTTSNSRYRTGYEPLVGGVYHAPYAYCYRCPMGRTRDNCSIECLDGVQRIFDHLVEPDQVAAMLVEPIQGEGGFVPPPKEFLAGLRSICDQHGILLILDEIQVGFGRTGHMFAADAYGVRPDIMCLAKSIASGMPLGATAAPNSLMRGWGAASHGTTFGGNPVAAAAGLATLEVMTEPGFITGARARGERLGQGLRQLAAGREDIVGDLRGMGSIYGMEFADPGTKQPRGDLAGRFFRGALERGLLLYPAGRWGQVVRFMPPLTASESEIDEGLSIIEAALKAI